MLLLAGAVGGDSARMPEAAAVLAVGEPGGRGSTTLTPGRRACLLRSRGGGGTVPRGQACGGGGSAAVAIAPADHGHGAGQGVLDQLHQRCLG
jgi:hypothetical protein